MILFATIATVCTMSVCNDYTIDTDQRLDGAQANTQAIQTTLDEAMQDEHKMDAWLARYIIGETVFEIVSIDLETAPIEK